jgi:hypothetical protein
LAETPKLARRPEARAFSVEALLQLAVDGKLRIPEFQRAQRWRSAHVLSLFDSVVRGFPVGEFLLAKQEAEADNLKFGPVAIDAPKVTDALFLVDGQQRMTALAGALLHPSPRPRGDIHAIWYDLDAEKFERLARGEPPHHWIPLNVVGDSFKLLSWLSSWSLHKERPELAKRAIALGKALREFQVPAYIVEGASEETLRLIFKRVNTAGVEMREAEVFEALYGRGRPVQAACARLAAIGFGPIDEGDFVDALKSIEGVNPRRRFRDSETELAVGRDAVARTEAALQRAITFLVGVAGIPHIALLPYRLPLRVLARFFHRHPTPDTRVESLLTRWIWRGALSRRHADNGDAVVEGLQNAIGHDPEAAAEAVLAGVGRDLEIPSVSEPWEGRSARTRLCALAMFSLAPRSPHSGAPISVDALQELLTTRSHIGDAFLAAPAAERVDEGLVVHRFLVERRDEIEALVADDMFPPSVDVLMSHGLDDVAVASLRRGELAEFERARAQALDPRIRRFFRERAALGDNDRPSIAAIVARAEAEVAAK